MAQLSMTMTEFGLGKGCIFLRFLMKSMKSSVLNEPSTTTHSIIPCIDIAGRIEYLCGLALVSFIVSCLTFFP